MNKLRAPTPARFLCALLVALAAPGCLELGPPSTNGPSSPRSPTVRQDVERVHLAWLEGDSLELVRAVRDVLLEEDSSPAERQNVLEVLERAWEDAEGHLPADWTLPDAVADLHFRQIRVEEVDGIRHQVVLAGRLRDADAVSRAVLLRADDGAIVLDSQREPGGLHVDEPAPGDPLRYFEVEGPELSEPPSPGVYLWRLTLSSGEEREGWFIAHASSSTASPQVWAPGEGEVVTSRQPHAAWEDFRSPEHRPYEARTLGLYLVQRTGRGEFAARWSSWSGEAGGTHDAVLGSATDGPAVELDDGAYWLAVTYGERRSFGPLQLVRASRTLRHFRVAGD